MLDHGTGTLFAGDLLFMERIPVVDGSLLGWLAVMDELERRCRPSGSSPATARPAAPWPAGARAAARLPRPPARSLRGELARNRTLEQAVDEMPPSRRAQHWLLAEENHARNVTASFTELEWE